MRPRIWIALFAGAVTALGVSEASARPTKPVVPRPISPPRKTKPVRPGPASAPPRPQGLKSRLGVAVAEALLKSKSEDDNVRGLERLGEVGTASAIELLAKSLEPGNASKTFAERLTTVRALSAHTDSPIARQARGRAMSGAGRGDDPGETLVRDAAALALARSGRRDALELLGKALRQEGPIAVSAGAALVAHPPRNIEPILGARGAPTLTLVEVLESLGDQRAFELLRRFVRHGSVEVRGRAALALTRLGDFETVALARQWQTKQKEPALLDAATRILGLARDAATSARIAKLLGDEKTAELGLELALANPSDSLLPALTKRADHADATGAPELLGAIGRLGSRGAAAYLAKQLERADRAQAAAYALALCSGSAATDELEHALALPATRRNAARAAVMREVSLGESVPGIDAALEVLVASSEPADRAAGAWGQASRDPAKAIALIRHSDPVIARAAARAALPVEVAAVAAERLATETDPTTRNALATALAREATARRVPTKLLVQLVEGGGAAAPLAAKALAARDERTTIEALLKSGDPLVRAHVALGLGDSRAPSAVGLLSQSYRFEPDANTRYAIVLALSQRKESSRRGTLALAAELDGDTRVRQAARLAVAGRRLSALTHGSGSLWIALADSQKSGAAPRMAVVGVPSGLSLPVAADPDGAITFAGVPRGPASLRLLSGEAP